MSRDENSPTVSTRPASGEPTNGERSRYAHPVPQRPVRLKTLDDLDQRTRAAKIARELVASLEMELGGSPSSAKQELVKRAALIGAMTEDFESRWLEGSATDISEYGALCDRQRRILESLGLVGVASANGGPLIDATPNVLRAMQGRL